MLYLTEYSIHDWRDVSCLVILVIAASMLVLTILYYYLKYKPSENGDGTHEKTLYFNTMLIVTLLLAVFAFVFFTANTMRHNLKGIQAEGLALEQQGDYQGAYDIYMGIYNDRGDWSDIRECIKRVEPMVMYDKGVKAMQEARWIDAYEILKKAGTYEHADILAEYSMYMNTIENHPEWMPYLGLHEIVEWHLEYEANQRAALEK